MRSRTPPLRVGPLVVDWRLTTRRLDTIGTEATRARRATDEGLVGRSRQDVAQLGALPGVAGPASPSNS
jgi:hypothetical protein